MMRITFISGVYPPLVYGGAELSTEALAKGFAGSGHDVSVLSLVETGPARDELRDGVHVFRFPARLPYWPFTPGTRSFARRLAFHLWDNFNLDAGRHVARRLDDLRPDVVSTQGLMGISSIVWGISQRRGAAVVHSIRDYNMLCPRSLMLRDGSACARQCGDCRALTTVRRRESRAVDAVVGNSRYTLDLHVREGYFPKATRHVVPPTIDLATVAPAAARTHADCIRFGFIGRISPEKGLHLACDALASLPDLPWRLIVAGKGDDAYLADSLKKLDPSRVENRGWSDPLSFYRDVDVVLAPAVWPEPAGRTIPEAYAYNLPVLASRVGGIPETVEEGRTGWLFDPAQNGDLRRCLIAAIEAHGKGPHDTARMQQLLAERTTAAALAAYGTIFEDAVETARRRSKAR